MKISGKTKITGLFGYPVEHSLSPAMHNAAFEVIGLDYRYVAFPVHPNFLKEAVGAIRALNLAGVNVTIPHKEKVITFLDEIDKEASIIGAVNTIVNSEGVLKGYNTDGRGFMQSLFECGISVEGKDVLIVGAGGASRALSYYLCKEAKKVYLYDIEKNKASKLVEDFDNIFGNIFTLENISNIDKFNILINATPLGLREEDPLPLDTTMLRQDQIVCDLIYKNTPLLKEAAKKGCLILNGLGMLLWQGVFAFELWTGVTPPVDIMRDALYKNV
ncbi:MAG: shikimate dehydrogenase [Nitrospirae bacterium]|nr:shikimate dehydrogenase [Nitrospirota bacterium]